MPNYVSMSMEVWAHNYRKARRDGLPGLQIRSQAMVS